MRRHRARASLIWNYFDVTNLEKKLASCKDCDGILSFRSTITNLKHHLKNKHKDTYTEFYRLQEIATHKGEGTSVKFSSEILKQFDHEDEEAKCSMCGEQVPSTIEDMKTHLEDQHSQVLDGIIAKAQNGLDSDNEADDENVYTEVVYIDSELPRSSKVQRTPKKRTYQDDPVSLPKHTEEIDETETFISYMRCLLKKVPKQSSAKLQVDIINLIVNSLNAPATSDSSEQAI